MKNRIDIHTPDNGALAFTAKIDLVIRPFVSTLKCENRCYFSMSRTSRGVALRYVRVCA